MSHLFQITSYLAERCQELAAFTCGAVACWLCWRLAGVIVEDQQWALIGVAGAAAVSGITTFVRLFDSRAIFAVPIGLWILFGWCLWGLAQAEISLPASWNSIANEIGDEGTMRALTIAPVLTRVAAIHGFFILCAFTLGATAFRSQSSRTWLWGLIAMNAVAICLSGIGNRMWWLQVSDWDRTIFSFGPFYNRNNAAGWLNLGIAAAVGLTATCGLVYSPERPFDKEERHFPHTPWNIGRKGFSRLLDDLTYHITPRHWGCALILAILYAGVVATLSRGGIISMHAALLTLFLLTRRRGGRVASFALIGLGITLILTAMGALISSGIGELALARMQTLNLVQLQQETLFRHWHDTLSAIRTSLPFGTGIGTYRFAILPFESRDFGHWFHHAENGFLEIALEQGIPGLLFAAAFIGAIIAALVHIKRQVRTKDRDLFLAGTYLLVSQLIHSCCDFGLNMLPNALTAALIVGCVCGTAAEQQCKSHHGKPSNLINGLLLSCALLASAGLLATRLSLLQQESRVGQVLKSTQLALHAQSVSKSDSIHAVQQAQDLVHRYPTDFRAWENLGKLHVATFRQELFRRSASQTPSLNQSEEERLWQATSLISLHAYLNTLARQDLRSLDQAIHDPLVQKHLRPALQAYTQAGRLCPNLPEIDIWKGAMRFLDGEISGEQDLRHACLKNPGRTDTMFRVGVMAHQASLSKVETEAFQICLGSSHRYLEEIARHYQTTQRLETFTQKLIPHEESALMKLLTMRNDLGLSTGEVRRLISLLSEQRTKSSRPRDAQWYYDAAQIAQIESNEGLAAEELRKAVQRQPQRAGWRLELTRLLIQMQVLDEARRHLSILKFSDDRNIKMEAAKLADKIKVSTMQISAD